MTCEVSCDYANGLLAQRDAAESELATLRAESSGRHTANLALCEEINRLRAENERLREVCDRTSQLNADVMRRALGAESRLTTVLAENERLREQNIEADLAWDTKLQAVESRLAAVQAENARLRARLDSEFTHGQLLHEVSSYRCGMMAAESRLATATELLKRWQASDDDWSWFDEPLERETDAFLANQPAAPAQHEMTEDEYYSYDPAAPARFDDFYGTDDEIHDQPAAPAVYHSRPGSDVFVTDRTEAEQRVLDVVDLACVGSRTWMMSNMPSLFAAWQEMKK